ncbi:hypothetical protein [Brevibacillus sp. SYSU BS000544]|uniref:hypothetical protein n=1 Tax=Brevibacillus sp. SYSU BS000544 TaxID=3416443 RepID=UPI003CE4E61B
MRHRWKYNPTYIKIKCHAKEILLPLIIFQFIRTLLIPASFDVIVLGLFALSYIAIVMDWI